MTRRICVYACYPRDANRDLPTYVGIALDSLKKAGYEVWLVMNRPDFIVSPKILDIVDDVMIRENECHDWGAYAHAVHSRRKDIEQADSLLLTNDSYLLPMFGQEQFEALLGKMWDQNFDGGWGMTSSHERVWHLQGYWMEYGRGVLSDHRFYNRLMNLDKMRECKDVHELIAKFELQDAAMFGDKYRFAAAFEIEQRKFRGNPYVVHWGSDLYPSGFPLYKFTVLRNHHATFVDGHRWRSLLRKAGYLGDHLVDEAIQRF